MIAFVTTWVRRVFGIPTPPSTPPRWATTNNETDALQAYCEVEFNPSTDKAMDGKRIIEEQDYDLEFQVVNTSSTPPSTTPEPRVEDKRTYDRDLNIEVENGRYVGTK